jgi:hypothetical protein
MAKKKRKLQSEPEQSYAHFNPEIAFATKANSFASVNDPKNGIMTIGNSGVEFRPYTTGFIQIPWKSVKQVRVQIVFFGKYVRGFYIDTNDGKVFNFVVSKARLAVKGISMFLPREKIKQAGTILNHQPNYKNKK